MPGWRSSMGGASRFSLHLWRQATTSGVSVRPTSTDRPAMEPRMKCCIRPCEPVPFCFFFNYEYHRFHSNSTVSGCHRITQKAMPSKKRLTNENVISSALGDTSIYARLSTFLWVVTPQRTHSEVKQLPPPQRSFFFVSKVLNFNAP